MLSSIVHSRGSAAFVLKLEIERLSMIGVCRLGLARIYARAKEAVNYTIMVQYNHLRSALDGCSRLERVASRRDRTGTGARGLSKIA
jgi:hypothetical protein